MKTKKRLAILTAVLLFTLTACMGYSSGVVSIYDDTTSIVFGDNIDAPEYTNEYTLTQDEQANDWKENLITEEKPREFWDNQSQGQIIADGIHDMFPMRANGWQHYYPDYFGGMYFDVDNMGRFTVLIVESLANSQEAQNFLTRIEELGGAHIRYVEFSQQALMDLQDYIFDMWQTNPAMQNVFGGGLDTVNNRIEINLLYGDDEDIATFKNEVSDSPMLTFTGTRSRQFTLGDIADELRVNPPLERVRMEVTNTSDLPQEITITITNRSNHSIMTGLAFTVEGFDGEHWRTVPMHAFFHMIGHTVQPMGSKDYDKNLAQTVGSLPPGLYRIRKDVFRDRDTPITDENLHDLVAEFYWEG